MSADKERIAELERKLIEKDIYYTRKLAESKEEGRKEAVPEGWQLIPKEPTIVMRELLQVRGGLSFLGTKEVYKAMLAAAPKPSGDQQ